jgi:hypothetical protein
MGEEDLEQLEGDILDSLEDVGYDKVIRPDPDPCQKFTYPEPRVQKTHGSGTLLTSRYQTKLVEFCSRYRYCLK